MIPIIHDRDKKLITYLAKHKHLSPFGHAFASFHVKAPIFVARQLVKHKFLRWNEISRRYVDTDIEYYLPDQWRGRSEDKKQGSEGEIKLSLFRKNCVKSSVTAAVAVYKELLSDGVAPEQARSLLPQNMITEWIWSGSLDAFSSMARLRCADDTQLESRIVADQISDRMGSLFPDSWKALMENE
jgi:thymidylate synthase (FAD)